MSNNKESSIEWLFEQIKNHIDAEDGSMGMNWLHDGTFKQAKAMHKEEQIDSLIEGMYKGQEMYFSEHKIKLDDNSSVFCAAIAENYYNETFNTHENNNRI